MKTYPDSFYSRALLTMLEVPVKNLKKVGTFKKSKNQVRKLAWRVNA